MNIRQIRAVVPAEARSASPVYALGLVSLCAAIVAGGFALFAIGHPIAGIAIGGFGLAAVFVCGHEAQHQCFTGSRRVDAVLAYVLLLPTWHAVRASTHAHVKLHHRFTNIRGRDPQWAPLSKADYDAAPWWRRGLERVYRSWWGFGLYWTIEVVVMIGFVPQAYSRGARHWLDRALVVGYVATTVAWQPVFAIGAVLAAHWVIGFATYFQHTGPSVRWYATPEAWSFYGAQIDGTQNFFLGIHHNAHHVDMTISARHLRSAQRAIDTAFATPRLRVRDMPAIVRACKLYDLERAAWTDFAGRITLPRACPSGSASGP